MRRYLGRLGLWDDERHAEAVAAAEAEIEQAVSRVAAAPRPEPRELFDNIFAEPTPAQQMQRQHLIDSIGS